MYLHVYQPLHGNQGNDTCSEHGDRQMPLAINMFWWLKVTGCAFSPRGDEVCSCAKDATRTLKIWAFPSGELKRTIAKCDGSKAIACAYSPDGSSICTGGFDKTLKLFDAATGELLRVIVERTLVQDSGHWSFIRGCAFSPRWWHARLMCGRRNMQALGCRALYCSKSLCGTLREPLYSRITKVESGQFKLSIPCGDDVDSVDFSPDGRVRSISGAQLAVGSAFVYSRRIKIRYEGPTRTSRSSAPLTRQPPVARQ